MAKGVYACIDGVSRNVKKIPVCIDGVSRNTKTGYACIDGVSRQFFPSGTLIGTLSVGTSVYMNVNGVRNEFLVVHQGKPGVGYDDSCNGTWLLMKNIHSMRRWDGTNNDYANSDIHAYLNGTFLGFFDNDIQQVIKQVNMKYYYNGLLPNLSTKVFLLSIYEVGFTDDDSESRYFPFDGRCLSYFSDSNLYTKRTGYYNGTATNWLLRSPYTNNTTDIWYVSYTGTNFRNGCSGQYGVRPAIILPSATVIDENFNIIA